MTKKNIWGSEKEQYFIIIYVQFVVRRYMHELVENQFSEVFLYLLLTYISQVYKLFSEEIGFHLLFLLHVLKQPYLLIYLKS